MKRVLRRVIEKEAVNKRRGYLEACLVAGTVNGDHVELSDDDFKRIQRRFKGLGDRIRDALKPIVKRIDRTFGTHLATCKACDQRRLKLNRLEVKIARWFSAKG